MRSAAHSLQPQLRCYARRLSVAALFSHCRSGVICVFHGDVALELAVRFPDLFIRVYIKKIASTSAGPQRPSRLCYGRGRVNIYDLGNQFGGPQVVWPWQPLSGPTAGPNDLVAVAASSGVALPALAALLLAVAHTAAAVRAPLPRLDRQLDFPNA